MQVVSLLFVPLWIDWVLDFSFFFLLRSFCTKSINVLTLQWVSLGVYCCLFYIWKGRFSWSMFNFGLISLKSAQSLIFSASLSNCFLLHFFGVGTKLRILFKSLKVSKENECFDKLVTFSDGSDLYLILLLIARCMLSVFIVCCIKVSTLIIFVWFVTWPPGVEAIYIFGLPQVMLLVWECVKIRISFFRFSISLSLWLSSHLILELLLDGDFPSWLERTQKWKVHINYKLNTIQITGKHLTGKEF